MIVPVVLSGGSGSRLWPLSRALYPKQLLPLVGEQTMLQGTLSRLEGVDGLAPPLVVCNEDHRFMVAEQLRQIGHSPSAIILEPVGRNTAPAAAVAALNAVKDGADPILLILPADHVIGNVEVLQRVVGCGGRQAERGKMVTFGVVPTGPETGFGYIRAGASLPGSTSGAEAFRIEAFVEKPDQETAGRYLQSGDYYWNSGMFMFRASVYLRELERLEPEMLSACREALDGSAVDLDFTRLDAEAFAACPGNSIDYAVMEKTDEGAILPLDAGWSDVGSWSALWEVSDRDGDDNAVAGDVLARDVKGSYLHATSRLLAVVGVERLVVVETADAVLVAHMDRVQEVKGVVDCLKEREREEAVSHHRVFRPWGSYERIDCAERFQVKRITVNPGGCLSHQMHHHRAEHWIIVKGSARITKGDEVVFLSENQSTYIPVGVKHRLENPGKIPLEFIEIQTGSYLGEDDIVRFDDTYGRH